MNEIEIRVVDLIEKQLNGELSDAEKQELETWENQSESNRRIVRHLTDNNHLKHSISDSYPDERKDRVLATIHAMIEADQGAVGKVRMMTIRKIMSAAAAIVVITIGSYVLLNHRTEQKIAKTEEKKTSVTSDIAPGTFKARLTLSDGSIIVLDSAAKGKLVQQGNTQVLNKDGSLAYAPNAAKPGLVIYNTLTTAKGEIYSLELSDGSKVWLNSASSIRYPVSFNGEERRVEITGEAYFEVAHLDNKQPFKVTANGMEVKVLGTHFNVNSYQDDAIIKTTLLEGSIRVTSVANSKTEVLAPGQQAQISDKGELKVIKDADVEKEVAWKDGLFIFKGDNVMEVMNQLSRWYNIDVIYQGKIPLLQFYGIINRNQPASNVLNILQTKGSHFKIDGSKIIVYP